ncbi:MAG TPA: hypothetical protein VNI01_07850, partial [Elusimicrobiota bacterium]|nr:hypothetical protein [Elusimicrobiota bacterium]
FRGPAEAGRLAGCSRQALGVACALYGPRLALGPLVLSPAQRFLAERARAGTEGSTCVLRAPPGFGKTATALAVVFSPQGRAAPGLRWAVFVPPKALCTWRFEIAKVLGADVFERAGGALVPHSMFPAHKKRFPDVQGTPAEPALVVTTWPTAPRRAMVERVLGWANRFIVDEAHTAPARLLEQLVGRRWALLLSANRVCVPEGLRADREIGGAGAEWLGGRCPALELRYALVAPCGEREAVAFARPCERPALVAQNAAAYLGAVVEALAPLRRAQVAVFLPDGKAGDHLAAGLGPRLRAGNWTVVPFARAVSKILAFERGVRSVLFIRLAQSEAVNICASHAVVVRPDWVNAGRFSQVLGRVLRPTNPNPCVTVTLVLPRGVALYRVAYYNAVRDPAASEAWWPKPRKNFHGLAYDRPDASDLLRAAFTLQVCGGRMTAASAPEIAAALGAGIEGGRACAEEVLAAWRKAPGALAEAQVRTLLGLAELGEAGGAGPGGAPPGGPAKLPPAGPAGPARPAELSPGGAAELACEAELVDALLAELG